MPKLTLQNLLFSVNSFGAAMTALFIALAAGLERPYWAMATVYIVSQPLSGAVRSKAVYRVIGTVLGGIATVALVPPLVDAPPLLCLALALWVGGCLTISLLDRTPRSYAVMLAGYTAALIGFPVVMHPETVFDVAVARVVEIGLGIVCASLWHSLIFPRPVGSVLQQRLRDWLEGADGWALDVLGYCSAETSARDRTRLAAAASEIHILATHLPFDTSRLRETRTGVQALHDQMLLLIPLLSGLADRLEAIEAEGGLDGETDGIRQAVVGWIRAGASVEDRAVLLDRIDRRAADQPVDDWRELLIESLLMRLREVVVALSDAHGLLGYLCTPDAPAPEEIRQAMAEAGHRPLHSDLPLALLSGVTAVIAILISSALWIGTGWEDGVTATTLTAVFCAFYATQDDPAPGIANFGRYAFFALPVAAVYLFAILPNLNGFVTLTIALAPTLLLIGLYVAEPGASGGAVPFVITLIAALSLQESYRADFAGFLNGNLAQFVGLFVSIAVTRTIRSISTQASIRRIVRLTWRGLADLARSRTAPERSVFAARLIDRLALLSPKLAGVGERGEELGEVVLADLRVAMNLVAVQGSRAALTGPATARLDAVSQGVGQHFSTLVRRGRRPPDPSLLATLDAALGEIGGMAGAAARAATAALVGLRRNLFPAAPAFRPASPGAGP